MLNVVEIGARRAQTGKSHLLAELSACVCERLGAAFRETLAASDDILFGHAQRAVNGMRQAQYFDDLRQLRLGQQTAVRAFVLAYKTAIQHGMTETRPAPARLAEDPLQLVADEDLELDLALFRVGKRCDETAPRLRHQVQRRLDVLLGLSDDAATPLSGTVIAKMCRAGLAPLDLGLESKLIVLKQLERRLATDMEPLLEAVNALLLGHGILPNLRATPAAPRAAAQMPGAHGIQRVSQPLAQASAEPADVQQQLGEVLSRMTQWMAQQAAAEAQLASESAPTPATAEPAVALPDEAAEAEQQRERRRMEIAERRAAEMERARELRVAAEKSADGVVSTVLSQAHIPDTIGNVMRGPLRRHLETVHARRGETSTEWRSACKLVRDIAWALDPETANSEQAHWRAMVPGIVASLRAALVSVGIDDHEVDRVVAEFGQRYERLLVQEAAAVTEREGAADVAAPATPASTEERAVPNFSDALRRVRHLALGSWFELIDDHGHPQRAKLVWTSAMTERCLFVNAHGKLIADRPHARVANDIVAGQFRELDAAATATA